MRTVLAGLMLMAVSAGAACSAETPPSDGPDSILAHVAWVQAAKDACQSDAPDLSGHLLQAYDGWLERNPAVRDLLHELEFGPDSDRMDARRDAFARLRFEAQTVFAAKRTAGPEDFSRACNDFAKDLAAGGWDYPRARDRSQ